MPAANAVAAPARCPFSQCGCPGCRAALPLCSFQVYRSPWGDVVLRPSDEGCAAGVGTLDGTDSAVGTFGDDAPFSLVASADYEVLQMEALNCTANYTVAWGRVLGVQSGASSTVASAALALALAATAAFAALA